VSSTESRLSLKTKVQKLWTEWPDEFVQKNRLNHVLSQSAQKSQKQPKKVCHFCIFFKNCPNVNHRPMCGNSPNLVTLMVANIAIRLCKYRQQKRDLKRCFSTQDKKNLSWKKIARTANRVARLFIFKPKLPIWVNLGGSCNGKSWYILLLLNVFWWHLVYFVVIWYIFLRFGILYQDKSGNPDRQKRKLPWDGSPVLPEFFSRCKIEYERGALYFPMLLKNFRVKCCLCFFPSKTPE
jgi:hypothetical protein